ncbi:MAG: glycosyltransferase family 4 protein, partial [Actinomycetota bacterium]
MRLLVDARPALDPRRTGVGTYAARLLEHLPAAAPDDTVVAWYLHARGLLRPRTFFPPAANLEERASRFPARVFQPLSFRLGVPRLEWLARFDALLATNFLPPPTRSRGVVLVVHDLAFVRHPETAPQMDDRFLRRFRGALAACASAIVPSRAVAGDLVAFGGIEEARIEVVPHGVDPARVPADAAARRNRLGVGEGRYALFVGGIEPRKNLPRLVAAFAALPGDARLVVAGGPVRWFPAAARDLDRAVAELPPAVRSRLLRVGYVDDADRAALLDGASLLAYPSLEEGFGLPVLEAMAAGVPVLTSDRSALPEVAGDAAVLVDPTDVDAIGAGLARLLDDDALRARLASAGRERASTFPWSAAARRTAAVL